MAPPALLAFPAQPGQVVRAGLRRSATIPAVRDATGPDGGKRAVLVACPPDPFLLPAPVMFHTPDDYVAAYQAAAEQAGAQPDIITASAALELGAAYGASGPVAIILVGADGSLSAAAAAALQSAGLVGVQLGLTGGSRFASRADGWAYDANWIQSVLVDWSVEPDPSLVQGPYARQALFFRRWASSGLLASGSVALTAWADDDAVAAYGQGCGACWLRTPVAGGWFATWATLVATAASTAAQQQARECGLAYVVSQVFNTLTSASGVCAPLPLCMAQALAPMTAAAAHILVFDTTGDSRCVLSDGDIPVAGRTVAVQDAVLGAARSAWLRNVLAPQQARPPQKPPRIVPQKVRAVLLSGSGWTRVPLPAGTAFVAGRTLAVGAWDRTGAVFTVFGVLTGPEWRLIPTWQAAWTAAKAAAARRVATVPTGAVLIPETVLSLS